MSERGAPDTMTRRDFLTRVRNWAGAAAAVGIGLGAAGANSEAAAAAAPDGNSSSTTGETAAVPEERVETHVDYSQIIRPETDVFFIAMSQRTGTPGNEYFAHVADHLSEMKTAGINTVALDGILPTDEATAAMVAKDGQQLRAQMDAQNYLHPSFRDAVVDTAQAAWDIQLGTLAFTKPYEGPQDVMNNMKFGHEIARPIVEHAQTHPDSRIAVIKFGDSVAHDMADKLSQDLGPDRFQAARVHLDAENSTTVTHHDRSTVNYAAQRYDTDITLTI